MPSHMHVRETGSFPTGGMTRQIALRFAVVYLLSNQEYTVAAKLTMRKQESPAARLAVGPQRALVLLESLAFFARTRCSRCFKFGWPWFYSLGSPWRPPFLRR